MKYALLLYQDTEFEAQWDAMDDEGKAAIYAQFAAFDEAVVERGGEVIGGNGLEVSSTATTVRRPVLGVSSYGDDAVVTDGPFAEVAEHLGGYIEIEARDLDHAIELAKLVPSATTEIRPILEAGGDA